MTGAERTSAWPIVQEAAQRFQLEIAPDPRPEQGSYYRSDHFMMARVGNPGVSGQDGIEDRRASRTISPTQQFREYNTKHYHQPSDEYRADWDFASLEHVARFGYLIGLNIANAAADAEVESRRRVREVTATRRARQRIDQITLMVSRDQSDFGSRFCHVNENKPH